MSDAPPKDIWAYYDPRPGMNGRFWMSEDRDDDWADFVDRIGRYTLAQDHSELIESLSLMRRDMRALALPDHGDDPEPAWFIDYAARIERAIAALGESV